MRKFQRLLFVLKRSYMYYYMICMTVHLTHWWLPSIIWFFDQSFDLKQVLKKSTWKSIARNFITLNALTKNVNKYQELRPRSQRRDRNIYIIVFIIMKLLVKTFIIKLFALINIFKKSINTFLSDFLYFL